jgi:hypothetical protein
MFYDIVTRLLARAMALNGSFSAMYSAALTPMALQIKVDSVKIVFLVREMTQHGRILSSLKLHFG